MTATEAVKAAMSSTGTRICDICNNTGIGQRALWNRLNRPNISVEKLTEICDAIGYKVVIAPVDSKIEGGFEVK